MRRLATPWPSFPRPLQLRPPLSILAYAVMHIVCPRINPIFLDIIRLPPRSVLSISFVSFTANVATVVIFVSSIGYFRRHPLSISASIPEESGIAAVAAAGITAASTRVERRWWYQPRLDVVVRLPCLATLCVASFSPAVPAVPPDSR